jgi:hypothetical protein
MYTFKSLIEPARIATVITVAAAGRRKAFD